MTDQDDNLFDLTGRVIVITGAAGMLGREHAQAVARQGGTPVLLDVRGPEVEALSIELHDTHQCASTSWAVDITDDEAVEEITRQVLERHSRIDGLVNNAANNPKLEDDQGSFSRLENFPLEQWHADLSVGLTGAFLCAKHFGPAMAANEEGGSIVNIASDLAFIAPDQRLYEKPGLPPEKQAVKPVTYSVVKTGLLGLTRYLSTYWPGRVRSNALCPGGVEQGQDETFISEITARIPLGRMARVNEYQGALIFLLSPASQYMTGTTVVADGGRSVW